jgi:hypothetical protein
VNESAPTEHIDLYRDLPSVDTATELGFYTYKSSLTTPACTEAVNWNLADKAILISLDQLRRFRYLILCHVAKNLGTNGVVESCNLATVASQSGSTSRPPQDLEGRRVIHRCGHGDC